MVIGVRGEIGLLIIEIVYNKTLYVSADGFITAIWAIFSSNLFVWDWLSSTEVPRWARGLGEWCLGRTRRLKRRWGGGGKTSLMRRIGKWGRRGWMLIGRTCDAKRQDVAHCYDEVERSKIPICHDERDDIQIKLGNRHCGVATGDGMRRI
jgi:hypothetical protein